MKYYKFVADVTWYINSTNQTISARNYHIFDDASEDILVIEAENKSDAIKKLIDFFNITSSKQHNCFVIYIEKKERLDIYIMPPNIIRDGDVEFKKTASYNNLKVIETEANYVSKIEE